MARDEIMRKTEKVLRFTKKVQRSMFNVQCSEFEKEVQCSTFNVQSSRFKKESSRYLATLRLRISSITSLVMEERSSLTVRQTTSRLTPK